jgi:acyl dehydratase
MTIELDAWSAVAVNLPEHADNAIHTDVGARAAGFPSALVAGVTVYAYLTHVPAAAWGYDWLAGGGGHVQFRTPVLEGDNVSFVPVNDTVEARVGGAMRSACAMSLVGARPPKCTGAGQRLDAISFVADQRWNDYAWRAGDDLAIYADEQIVHPVTWMRVANDFFHTQVVNGSWIHVRSNLQHLGVASIGSQIDATAVVVERFDSRAGKRAILDVEISADGTPVARYEHEAIIELP